MKIFFPLIEQMHLDSAHALLSVQNIVTTIELFHAMDIHHKKCINDVQFNCFMKHQTDLDNREIQVIFKLLDVDQSGEIEFDEFYLIFCIMVACKDQYEKEFIYRHSAGIFQLIDQDSSGHVSSQEFANMGILFNFDKNSIMSIFNEFDISGDKNLDFSEFRLFTMACIDEQRGIEANKKVTAFRDYNHRLLENLKPVIKRYIQTRVPPPPAEIERAVDSTEPPYILPTKYRKSCLQNTTDLVLAIGYIFLLLFKCILKCYRKCCRHMVHSNKIKFGCRRRRRVAAETIEDEAINRMENRPETNLKFRLKDHSNHSIQFDFGTALAQARSSTNDFRERSTKSKYFSVKKFD